MGHHTGSLLGSVAYKNNIYQYLSWYGKSTNDTTSLRSLVHSLTGKYLVFRKWMVQKVVQLSLTLLKVPAFVYNEQIWRLFGLATRIFWSFFPRWPSVKYLLIRVAKQQQIFLETVYSTLVDEQMSSTWSTDNYLF